MGVNFVLKWAEKLRSWFCITMFIVGVFSSYTLFQVKVLHKDVRVGGTD